MTVKEYYRRIDAGDIDWVVQLFAEEGTYDRAGAIYRGKALIRDFYERERKVRLTHHDLRLWQVDEHVFVEGSFTGWGLHDTARNGQFADHWIFDGAGNVTYRRTSLFTGAELICK